jgi:hypothetical protein
VSLGGIGPSAIATVAVDQRHAHRSTVTPHRRQTLETVKHHLKLIRQ